MGRSDLTAMLMGGVAVIAVAVPAQAQTATYNIPKGELRAALATYIRQSGVQLVFRTEDVRGKRTLGVRGVMSPEAALDQLLAGTGLSAVRDANGAVVVAARQAQRAEGNDSALESADAGATPEILVTGKREWTLNTDIKRTRDDAQPYVVFDRKQIEQSGVTNLEDFLHDYLNANVAGSTQRQNGSLNRGNRIDLRGLGPDETLILVDGRRIAPLNTGSGTIDQPAITGIPMAAIDRIEVLASSASGIYGSNATGGVLNIVLKRDYRGLDVSATYGGSFDGGGRSRRIDVTGGMSLEGGRTNVMATLSWRKDDPLEIGDRDLYQRGIAEILANNPRLLTTTTTPPLGATPNIRSSTGAVLTLDPAYGGGSLGSAFTYVPYGFRGVAQDGVAPLVANAGRYNFDLAPTAQIGSFPTGRGGGARVRLLQGAESLSGTVAIRREIAPGLKFFVEAAASHDVGDMLSNTALNQITVAANAPNNPFQQAIIVTVPQIGADQRRSYESTDIRFTGGALFNLPYGWTGSADYSWDHNWSRSNSPASVDNSINLAMASGSIDVLRDLAVNPVAYTYAPGSVSEQFPATTQTASLRLAGPLPIHLPGGRPTVTIQAQRTKTEYGDARSFSGDYRSAVGTYYPARNQTTDSAYFEARLPVVGASNRVPFINEFELQVAARYERYRVVGANMTVQCFSFSRPLTEADLSLPCPPTAVPVATAVSSRPSFNPTFSAKWKPAPDLMLRASYATGFRPPDANNLIKAAPTLIAVIGVTDPERGNELFGTAGAGPIRTIAGNAGGNPDVKPERSWSYTAGAVLTPRGIPGLRLSVDWTKIVKRDNYALGSQFLLDGSGTGALQPAFEVFLRDHPDRIIRDTNPATFGAYSVGPITYIDASAVNIAGSSVGAIDFAGDYSTKLGQGTLSFSLNATYAYDLSVQISEVSPSTQNAGVGSSVFFSAGGEGGTEWKGNLTVRYDTDRWNLGVRARYFDSFYLNTAHTVDVNQGDNSVPSQAYFDVFGAYKILRNTEVKTGARNVLNTRPPFSAVGRNLYSAFGDPSLATYYVTISQKF